MKNNWLWDRKITDGEAKKILKKPGAENFITMAALLLSRKNESRDVFKNYISPLAFCKYWPSIKRKMRQDKWADPRIVFWQAIYEKLMTRYREKGMSFRQESPAREKFCEAIGKKMSVVRRGQGLSQKQLAKKIGISQQVISRIESGGENVSLITLTRIARALDKKIEINFVT